MKVLCLEELKFAPVRVWIKGGGRDNYLRRAKGVFGSQFRCSARPYVEVHTFSLRCKKMMRISVVVPDSEVGAVQSTRTSSYSLIPQEKGCPTLSAAAK